MKINYICAQTKKQIESDEGLPNGWVIPVIDLSQDQDKPVPPRGTVIAFSSQKAVDEYRRNLLEAKMRSSEF